MTPADEQMLRNQLVIMNMMNCLMPVSDAAVRIMESALKRINETGTLLETEHQQGRTVHAYPA